jgi:hypothetical protein
MSLQLTIACGDYDRTHPLIDGSIKPEGLGAPAGSCCRNLEHLDAHVELL